MFIKPILEVENFSKTFMLHEQGKELPSSHNVFLKAYAGRLTAIIGPTGAGKSTVLKGIYRTYLPTSGRMMFTMENGQQIDLATADEHQILALRQNEIGFVTQFLHTLPRQPTENVVAMPLIKKGMERRLAIEKARETLAKLNLPERLWGISPATFSGGEKQRVNLARGLLARPNLLLLDEPTASLDPKTTDRVVELIDNLKQSGTAVIAIFHDLNLVERLADKVVELEPPIGTEQFFNDTRKVL
ncbi:MAG: phosphonate C-P lyase system protein PhnL [Hydrogenovibrio crunogenus]|jgi:alpha-D-ribose 1-methylphosphonate 5-triphosphate synthase subunit PhnL|uniref:Alpha-D-ribose 1-methylphosphonate 5-triphosphate synthase subunit PhnL n=2 Tax=Hydrogenovibrio crunogenus TaxID=39765 RepID=A0A4P7P2D9_9GAMM|nr:phosphonate C-P lyase system protein PhnL [Hydrogenovibrio crunogenus]MBD3612570.1 phosphonate C-P lyase system protein PhnL [Hydrogenovibrio crunogenus]QBZ84169.1 Alpha-D-ribose 1-methylphosphonate 5-triphosphate synthase subunit PhnL [Hydrogenovibrio crunogenus]